MDIEKELREIYKVGFSHATKLAIGWLKLINQDTSGFEELLKRFLEEE